MTNEDKKTKAVTAVEEQGEKKDNQIENISPTSAILSLLCSIGVGLCWYFRNFEFRQKFSGPGSQGGGWLMMDLNVGLRRLMLILTIVGLFLGFRAVSKRCKVFDIFAFVIAAIIGIFVGYIVYQMGGKGFWLSGQ